MKQKKVSYKIIIAIAIALAFITPTSIVGTSRGPTEPSASLESKASNNQHQPISDEGTNIKTSAQSPTTPAYDTSILISTSRPSTRGETIYVDDDAIYPGNGTFLWPYHCIWQGVQNASSGDTVYVFNGTYYENIVVDKSVNIIGENREATIVNGSDTGKAFYVTANNVLIAHFTIENNDAIGIQLTSKYNQILDCCCVRMGWIYGIWITDSNNHITNCTCLNSYIGIYVGSDSNQITNCTCSYNRVAGIMIDTGCKYNLITNCTCTENKLNGLYLYQHANYNQVEGCTFAGNLGMGLLIERSCSNLFRNNTINNNTYNFGVMSYNLITEFTQDIDPSNTINGKPIYYLVGEQDRTLNGTIQTIGYVALVSCNNITISNIAVERNLFGLPIINTSDSSVVNCSFTDNQQNGIFLLSSSRNHLINCTCSDNPAQGILGSLSTTDNEIKDCTCSHNNNDGIYLTEGGNQIIHTTCLENDFIGIHVTASPLTIQNCNASGNHQNGMYIYTAPSCQITECVCNNNRGTGISLSSCPDSVITGCDCSGNFNKGIEISDSSDCTLTDSTCIGNTNRGMEVTSLSPILITGCTCSNTQGDGMYLDYQSSNSVIENCISSNNLGNGISSKVNQITSCTFVDNQQNGISGQLNHITACWIEGNQQNGIAGLANHITFCTVLFNHLNGINGGSEITDSTISENDQHGIYIEGENAGHLMRCIISENNRSGLYLYKAPNYQITNCTMDHNRFGLYINQSSSSVLRDCDLWHNTYGCTIDGTDISHFVQDIDPSNIVNGKPIFYLVGQNGALIDGNVIDIGYIALIQCTNCVLKNIHIDNSSQGALVILSSSSIIINSSFTHNLLNGIYLAGSEYTQLINCTCSANQGNGIYLSYADNNQLTNCTCLGNQRSGINLSNSLSTTITNCVSMDNGAFGIHLNLSCDNTQLSGCVSSHNTYGVFLYGSAYTIMRNNTITNNTYNFGMFPVKSEDVNQDIDATNTVDGKPIYFIVGQNDLVFDGDVTPIGYLVLVQCTYIQLRNFNITHNIQGLCLVQCTHCIMQNLNCSYNYLDGIFLVLNSENNTITNCVCSDNNRHGIYLWVIANTNHITGCTCSGNQGNGIELDALWGAGCNYNLIDNCICEQNHMSGIYSVESKYNWITGCTCSSNQESGIELTWMSWDNTVTHCVCWYNQQCGIDLQWMSTTYLNNCSCLYNRYGISTHGSDTQLKDSSFLHNEIGIRLTTGDGAEYITNCVCLENTRYGIYGHQIRSHQITNCNISGNQGDGIYLEYYSTNNQITGCIISQNMGTGINISDQSDTHRIEDNVISQNGNGMYLSQIISFVLSNNSILDNEGYSLFIDGSDISYFRHDIDTSNTINGKKVYYLVDENDQTITGDIGYLTLISCHNITAQDAEVPGVLLMDTTGSTLSNISTHGSANGIGIYLWSSHDNTIINCTTYENDFRGFYLRSSPNNVLRGTTISNNSVDFVVDGDLISDYYQDVDTSNTINGKPIYYLIGDHDRIIDDSDNIGYLSLISCANITVHNLDLPGLLLANTTDSTLTNILSHRSGKGIYLWDSSYNQLLDCTVYDNAEQGILLRNSRWNILEDCDAHNNMGDGVQLMESSTYNQITGCCVYGNSGGFGGINIEFSSDNTIANCTVHDNTGLIALRSDYSQRVHVLNCTIYNTTWYGIYFYTWTDGSDDCSVVNCAVYNISYYGIYFMVTDNSLIKNCSVRNTTNGIYMAWNSNNNKLYYNTLRDNDVNGYDECTNQWDDGDWKGNQWSDYIGVDRNNDDIGDTPYLIPGGFNKDNYPIMPPDLPPFTPSMPSPWDGATKVSTDMKLSWNGGDPNVGDTPTYDAYFGTTNPPPQVTNNQTMTTYDPGTMSLNTTYYWTVVAWDNHGLSSAAPVWCFTTELINEPPYLPSNPSPVNDTVDVSVTAHLSWTGSDPNLGDTLTYDVYFGTTTPPPNVSSHQTETTYNPGMMCPGTIYYWKIIAMDNHGLSNESPIWQFMTILDVIPPVTTITFNGTLGGEDWYTSIVTVSLDASDDISGVNATYYRINNEAWILYEGPFNLTSDGTYVIDYYSEDIVGNTETSQTASCKIDQTPPVTTPLFNPPAPNGENGWYISSITVTLSVTDEDSGPGSTWYKVDTDPWQLYTVPFPVEGDGVHALSYFSFDQAGNTEEAGASEVKIDTTPPVTTPEFHGLTGEDGWFVTNVSITLIAEDVLSGMNYTIYKLDTGAWSVYTVPITVSENGNHTVSYYSVDLAGNIEQTEESVFRIDHDTEPPQTTHQFDGIMGTHGWFVSTVKVTLSGLDFSPSGINHTYYKLDNQGDWIEYTQPFYISQDGIHILSYYSVDMVGNEEEVHNVTLKLDQSAPDIVLSVMQENSLKTKWLLNASVADATSGVALVEFYVDSVLLGNVTAPGPYIWHYEGHGKKAQAIVYDDAGNSAVSQQVSQGQPNVDSEPLLLPTAQQNAPLFAQQKLLTQQ
jgi:parallel beta-helix repeat protein